MTENFNGKIALSVISDFNRGILIFNDVMKCIYANPAVGKITGHDPADLVDKNPFQLLFGGAESEEAGILIGNMKKEDTVEKEIKIIKKNGEAAVINFTGFFSLDFLIIIIQDISNKKVVEKMLESSIDGFIHTTIDLDQAIKTINEQKDILDRYKKNIERELDVARSVQRNITPENFLSNDLISLWGVSLPSNELGGDYFDYFTFDMSKLGIVVADVSGHGVPSALITTMIKVCFERYGREYVEIENVFKLVNKEIVNILKETGFYLTSIYSVIDLDNMTVSCASAGHDCGLCYCPEKEEVFELGVAGKGSLIGCFEDAYYESSKYNLSKGCKIVFFTDGITEARNKAGEFFGKERLKDFLKENNSLPAHEFTDALIDCVDRFYGGAKPNDDRTVFVIDIIDVPDLKAMPENRINSIIDNAFKNGRKYIKNREYKAAVNEFQKIVELSPGNFGAYSYLGQIYGMQKEFENAEKYLLKSIELNGSYIEGYYYMGSVLYNQKKYADAKIYWLKLKNMADNFRNINYYLEKIEQMGNESTDSSRQ